MKKSYKFYYNNEVKYTELGWNSHKEKYSKQKTTHSRELIPNGA